MSTIQKKHNFSEVGIYRVWGKTAEGKLLKLRVMACCWSDAVEALSKQTQDWDFSIEGMVEEIDAKDCIYSEYSVGMYLAQAIKNRREREEQTAE